MAQRDLIDLQNEANEDEEEDKLKEPPSRTQIIGRAVAYLVIGVAIAIIFADPLVGAIGGFAKASALSPFFVSFVATSLATSSSEAVSSVIFAKRKRKRNISMTYSLVGYLTFLHMTPTEDTHCTPLHAFYSITP